jgi:hypothetical protein
MLFPGAKIPLIVVMPAIAPDPPRVAPAETKRLSEPVPEPLVLLTISVPVLTVVPPVKVLLPVSVSVPAPFFLRAPVPEIMVDTVRASLRLIANVPLLLMPLVEEIAPLVPPAPICSVPALIVVVPV